MKTFGLALALFCNTVYAENVILGDFSHQRLENWETQRFKGETRYQLKWVDGINALSADSQAAASGLFKEQRVDLSKTPYLNWSWRITNRLNGLNEQSKAGDDYAARVYVLVKGGLAFWQTKAVNYVWASNSPQGQIWPNAYAGEQAMMLAVRGPETPLNRWQSEKRNVRADLQQLFGKDFAYIDGVAIMTDTDDSGSSVSAAYGDVWFSGE